MVRQENRPKFAAKSLEIPRAGSFGRNQESENLAPQSGRGKGFALLGKYRVLFSVDDKNQLVTVILVGEKRGNRLLVLGEEFSAHHESDPIE